MKNHSIIFSIFLLAIVLQTAACSKKQIQESQPTTQMITDMNYDSLWQEIDSLDQKKLYRSAQKKVLVLRDISKANNSSVHWIKSQIYLSKYAYNLNEDDIEAAIDGLEQSVQTSSGIERAVLYSLTAELYKKYLQRYGYKIRQRTTTEEAIPEDIKTWTATDLINKSTEYYLKSLEDTSVLNTTIDDYNELLKEYNTIELTPTLYDVLAHRAINYFNENLWSLTDFDPEAHLDDIKYLAPYQEFISVAIEVSGPESVKSQALKIMQDLIDFHRLDSVPDALVHADLKRLQFVFHNLRSESKDAYYLEALNSLFEQFNDDAASTEIAFHIASWYQRHGNQFRDGNEDARDDLRKAAEICRAAIESFPKSYGAVSCGNLLSNLMQRELTLQTERVWIPGEHHLLNINYRNVEKAFIRVIPVAVDDAIRFERLRGDRRSYLSSLEPIQELEVDLSGIEDLRSHSTEYGIDPLPAGTYVLLISDAKSFDEFSQLAFTTMSVSRISFWQEQQPNGSLSDSINVLEGYRSAHYSRFVVVDRKTGAPIPEAMVEVYTMIYQPGSREQELVYLSRGTTDKNGVVDNLNTKNNRHLIPKITVGDDVLFLSGNYNAQVKHKSSQGRKRAFLFTDRAIYRPGQMIHFKGYLLDFDEDNLPSVAAGQDVTVKFNNVNGKTIDTLMLRTNAFGTFSADARVPANGLTGRMTLVCEKYGRQSVQVEEYKRPQFEVNIDPPELATKLGDTVEVQGKAIMYSGVPVFNASVTYTVARQIYFPYWRWYGGMGRYPGMDRKVIATGKAVTDASGKFNIEFRTELLKEMPAHFHPEYNYVVSVDVTDQAGETQSGSKAIRLNNIGFSVKINIGDELDVAEAFAIPIKVSTLDGKPVSATIKVVGQQLESIDRLLRDRMWKEPEFTGIDSAHYQRDFPRYSFPLEKSLSHRRVVNSYPPITFQVNNIDSLDLSSILESAGLYKLSIIISTNTGDTLSLEKFVSCNDKKRRDYATVGSVKLNSIQKTFQPNETLLHRFDSDIPVHLRYRIGRNKELSAKWHLLTDSLLLSTKIKEEDRGGFSVQYIYVYDGRFYSKNINVAVPWTNKNLKVDFLSYRDLTQPGAKEEWRIKISGADKDPVIAEMLATMYDASLDAFVPHNWKLNLFPTNRPRLIVLQHCFGSANSRFLHHRTSTGYQNMTQRKFPDFDWFGFPGLYSAYHQRGAVEVMSAPAMENDAIDVRDGSGEKNKNSESTLPSSVNEAQDEDVLETDEDIPFSIRTNLKETVFFIPHALTDEEGNITLRFEMNEALTRWKFMSIFHTPDLQYALAEKEVVTQKELMVMPHVPRFLRQKDTVSLTTRVYNNSEKTIHGTVKLKLLDALTGGSMSSLVPAGNHSENLMLAPDSTKIFRWYVVVPDDLIAPIRYQFLASGEAVVNGEVVVGDAIGDGEEGILPVVTDRVFVTESKVLFTPAESTKTFKFDATSTQRSPSFEPFKLTLEYTSNPAWYAVQALPYLQEYPHQCVEQQFNRMYANALGGHIVEQFPEIQQIFDSWKNKDSKGLMSNLSRNQELKSILIEETPWLRDAESEEEQMKNIASLFEAYKLSEETSKSLQAIAEAQLSNGGFPWFPGGRDNWYITQYIVEGIGRLEKLGVLNDEMTRELRPIMTSAIEYIDQRLVETYRKLSDRVNKGETTFEENHLSNLIAHYLYTRSFFPDVVAEGGDWAKVYAYYTQQAEKYWSDQSLYSQALIATALYRDGNYNQEVSIIKQSFEERSLFEEDRGRFWKSGNGWYWHEAPIERHATMIEFFAEVRDDNAADNNDQKFIDELRQYLLMHKQTNRWSTTKSTSAAIYALLLQGSNWLEGEQVTISSGNEQITFDDPVAGSLYSKKTWSGDAIEDFSTDLTVDNPNQHVSWGGVYLQYFEDLDDVKSDAGEQLRVKKTLYIAEMSDNKRRLVALKGDAKLKLGDELVVRVEIHTDRDLEFVHLKDMRASALEPVNVISRYKYQDGLGYYESTRDLATHFFFDRMSRGTYVFEYSLRVSHAGSFSNGIATLQCMYAPEFAAHSESARLTVID